MTEHDQETGGPRPNPSSGTWSSTDQRQLMISFAGGLAANVGIVLIVGGSVAIDRAINKSDLKTHHFIIGYLGILGLVALINMITIRTYRKRVKSRAATNLNSLILKLVRVYFWAYAIFFGISVLVYVGVAAGFSK